MSPPPALISDPTEYRIDRVSRDAGRAIFERTGIGDPYRTGVPYPIFLALVSGFPDELGGSVAGLAAKFGLIARAPDPTASDLAAREGLPIGLHLTIDPWTTVPFVVGNCTLCHAERIAWPGGDALIIGLGNKRIAIHDYDAAWSRITGRPGFSADRITRLAAAAADQRKLAWPIEYRQPLIAATVDGLVRRARQRAALHARTAGGLPGRVATIEAFAHVLSELTGQPIDFAPTTGWVKVPDVIGYAHRTTLSWDGSQEGPIDLLAVEADVAAGVRVEWLEQHPLQGASLGAYLRQPAARPPFPGPIDRKRAARGHALFDDNCRPCHGRYGSDGRVIEYDEQIVELGDLGTDPARAAAATESFARAANDPKLTRGFTRFRRSPGYVPPVLTNVWARAPYGHVGQWPSLAVLALAPAARPRKFAVDLATYDLVHVGVATTADRATYHFDASRPGFSVDGHPFLADLGAGDASAVIEYLKTL